MVHNLGIAEARQPLAWKRRRGAREGPGKMGLQGLDGGQLLFQF